MILLARTPMQKELSNQLNSLKHKVISLRASLNRIQTKRESNYKRKLKLSLRISELIERIKELKRERDSITAEVREKKKRRNDLNTAISDLLREISLLQKRKKEFMSKHNLRLPSEIRKEINSLDYKIETEGYTFEREKSIMKRLKELKLQLEKSKVLGEIITEINDKKSAATSKRAEANELHSFITSESIKSQEIHEELLKISKEIDDLRHQREEATKAWKGLKNEALKFWAELNDNLQKLSKLKAEHERLKSIELQAKEEEVQAKIRKGEKLTTEDILGFQNFLK